MMVNTGKSSLFTDYRQIWWQFFINDEININDDFNTDDDIDDNFNDNEVFFMQNMMKFINEL